MHKSFRKYSRNSQELIYWLINDYACKLQEIEVGQTASEYYRYQAKKQLKKLYMKHTGINLKELNPFKNFYGDMKVKIEDTLKKKVSDNSKTEIILSDMDFLIRQEFQKLTLALDGTFSLCLNLMSQDKANKFIQWLFDYLLDKEIPMRKEIVNLYAEAENERFIYAMLKHKKCCICGREVTFPHHHKSVNFVGGYKKDKGELPIAPLCQYHHSELHSAIDRNKWIKEHSTYGFITCNEEQVKELKKIYKGLFMADKEKEE